MPDYEWWEQNGRAVKARLTRAEKALKTNPQGALTVATEVLDLMEAHGYPDWWHRVERLRTDALFQRDRALPAPWEEDLI